MKTKYTFLIVASTVLVAVQLTSCKSSQTFSATNNSKPINFRGMGTKNTCSLSHASRKELKYLQQYDYCEGLKGNYTQNSNADIDNNAVGAGAAYILITGRR